MGSTRYNPLSAALITDIPEAYTIARLIVGNLFSYRLDTIQQQKVWHIDLLAGMIWFLKRVDEKGVYESGLCSLPHLIELATLPSRLLVSFFKSDKELKQFVQFRGNKGVYRSLDLMNKMLVDRLGKQELYWVLTDPADESTRKKPNCMLVESDTASVYTGRVAMSLLLHRASRSFYPQAAASSVVMIDEAVALYIDDLGGMLARHRRNNVATYLASETFHWIGQPKNQPISPFAVDQLGHLLVSRLTDEMAMSVGQTFGLKDAKVLTQLEPDV